MQAAKPKIPELTIHSLIGTNFLPIDLAYIHIIEMVNNSTTPMLVKASTDVVGFQNMNQQILTVTYER